MKESIQTTRACWKRGLIIFLVYYVLLFTGGAIIMLIEAKGLEGVKISTTNITDTLDNFLRSELNFTANETTIGKIIAISNDIARKRKKMKVMKWKKTVCWETFYKWRYFAHITLTTVGFGDIVPDTIAGKIFVMIYSTVGIPFNIVVTTTIGYLMSANLVKLIQTIETRVIKIPVTKHVHEKACFLLAIMCGAWLVVGAKIITSKKGWNFADSYYASFVVFSTIGYGDYTVDFSEVGYFREILFWYTNVGLAMVAGIFDSVTSGMEKVTKNKKPNGTKQTIKVAPMEVDEAQTESIEIKDLQMSQRGVDKDRIDKRQNNSC